jgi:hypothetical protein
MSIYNGLPSSYKVTGASKLTNLIFFQNADFFHQKLGIASLPWKTDLKIEQSIPYLINLSSCCSTITLNSISELITRIITTLNNFRKDFYYVYASDSTENNKGIVLSSSASRKHVEYQVKVSLNKINIHTTAAAKTVITTPIQVDLSQIQNELVNVGGHLYNDKLGNYIYPLIL